MNNRTSSPNIQTVEFSNEGGAGAGMAGGSPDAANNSAQHFAIHSPESDPMFAGSAPGQPTSFSSFVEGTEVQNKKETTRASSANANAAGAREDREVRQLMTIARQQ